MALMVQVGLPSFVGIPVPLDDAQPLRKRLALPRATMPFAHRDRGVSDPVVSVFAGSVIISCICILLSSARGRPNRTRRPYAAPIFPKSSSGPTSLLISLPRHVAAKLVILRELSCSCACARTRRAEADFTQVQRTGRNRQHHRTEVECPWRSPLRSIAVFVDNYLTNKGLLTSNVEITLKRSFVYCYRPCAP